MKKQTLESIFISKSATLIEALRVINDGSVQIALVVDNKKRLMGTLTDGDIRRGLLSGFSLSSPVDEIMNKDFQYALLNQEKTKIIDAMKNNIVRQVPVLDDERQVVDLILLSDLILPSPCNNAVVIMAGGQGKRLRPYTENCPKPMLPVDGKPMLEILLEQCIKEGFNRFYFSVNYLKHMIIDHFEDGSKWGVSIDYLHETKPLGTAGSLQLLPPSVNEAFLVLNGDVLTKLNPSQLLRFHDEHNAAATMCVRDHITTLPFGVVKTDGIDFLAIEEKPSYHQLVNAGIYVVNPSLCQLISPGTRIDMPDLLQLAQKSGSRVVTCPIHEYWIDVGNSDALKKAHDQWSN